MLGGFDAFMLAVGVNMFDVGVIVLANKSSCGVYYVILSYA